MDQRDFFISHADSDLAWAEWIAQQLVEAGYTVELDVWDWAAGTNLVDAMRHALERAERVLAVYTDAYFAQRLSQAEHTAAFASDQPGRVVPVVVADCSIPELYAPLTRIELLGLEEDDARRRLLDGVLAGSRRPGSPVTFPGRVEFPRRLPRIWNVPARNPFFTGRDDLLQALDGRLRQPDSEAIAVVPLRGMGGVGKTQLAVEYAHRRAAGYEIVWWVNAENPTLATNGLVELAAALGLPTAGAPAEVLRLLWSALARRTDWLLIYDNADSPTALAERRPPDSGRLLLTSRNPAFSRLADLVEVGDFDRSESVALLRHRCPALPPGQADQIAAAVGDLPLAVEQAGCFLQETGLDVADYLGLLAAAPAHAGLDDPTVDRHPGLVAVVTASRARLRAASPRAAVVLDQLAFCAPELLPLTPRRPAGDSGRFGVEIGDSAATADVVRQLTSLGLARNRGTALQVHRLVQALVRSFLSNSEQVQRCRQAQELLATVRPGNHDDPTVWSLYAVLTPHVQSLVAHSFSLGVTENQDFRVLLLDVVRYLEQSGRSRNALEMSLAAYQRWSKALGGDHPDTLTAAHRYGNALVRLGDYGAARKVFESTHAGRGRALGADHVLTLGTAANLAVVAALAGDEQAARRITEDVLNRRRRVLGPDHPDTLESASNLAAHLDGLGEWRAAKELGKDILTRRRRVLGKNHPRTLESAHNLACAISYAEPREARPIVEDVLARRQQILGKDHPQTLGSASVLAEILRVLGELDAARTLNEDILTRRRGILGDDHPDTLVSAAVLALCLAGLGELRAARDLDADTLPLLRRVRGNDHRNTLAVAHNLAISLRILGEPEEARRIEEDVVARRQQVLGPDHEHTLDAAATLCACLADLGDLEAAHDLAKRIVTRRQQTLGPDHRDTVASIDLLQDVRAKQRQRGEGTKRGIGARRWRRK